MVSLKLGKKIFGLYNFKSIDDTPAGMLLHLSNNEILEIASKYKAEKSTYELAKEYGCHRRTISDNLKKRGIKVTNQLMERKGVVELVMQMYSEYCKPDDIAKAVGINVDSVRKILKKNNMYIRKSWEYPRK